MRLHKKRGSKRGQEQYRGVMIDLRAFGGWVGCVNWGGLCESCPVRLLATGGTAH